MPKFDSIPLFDFPVLWSLDVSAPEMRRHWKAPKFSIYVNGKTKVRFAKMNPEKTEAQLLQRNFDCTTACLEMDLTI